MDMRIPPLKTKILLESPLKSRILVQRLAAPRAKCSPSRGRAEGPAATQAGRSGWS